MKASHPPIVATKLLERLASGSHGDALAGDLIEQYQQGRSAVWYWRQVLFAIVVYIAKDRTLGGPAVLGSLLVLLLISVSASRHPSSVQDFGAGLLITDVGLLLACGAFSAWVWCQRRSDARNALTVGAQTGLILGAAFVANHAIESFAPVGNRTAQLVRGAGSVLLMLALLGATGSAAWERTRSVMLGVIAGLWCASVAILITLGFAFTSNLAFEAHAAARLYEPFVASGMSDAGAFVVRNSLQAASEILVRMPIAALALSFLGSFFNAWITTRSRSLAIVAAWVTPFTFVAGAAALWYADSLERAARPPFVIAGVLTAGIAVCGAHPIWASLSRSGQRCG